MQTHLTPTPSPESFIVRIYRRDTRGPNRVAGTVEIVATGEELSFAGPRELQRILRVSARRPKLMKVNKKDT